MNTGFRIHKDSSPRMHAYNRKAYSERGGLDCVRHDMEHACCGTPANLAAVMKTMGHRDVRTTMNYQHPELEIVRAALNRPQNQPNNQ